MIIKGTDGCPGVAYATAYYIKADRFVSRKRARERDWNRDEIDVTSCSFWLTNDDDDSRKLSSRFRFSQLFCDTVLSQGDGDRRM